MGKKLFLFSMTLRKTTSIHDPYPPGITRTIRRFLLFLPLAGWYPLFAAPPAETAPPAVDPQSARYQSVLFDKLEVTEDVVFRTALNRKGNAEELKLDIYRPAGDTETQRPALLWIHGGGFQPGNDKRQKYIVAMATEFARRGYVCMAPDYRVRENPKTDFQGTLQDAVEDCRAALQWMRAESRTYGLDPKRIAVGGGSAGGMTAVSLVLLENNQAVRSGRAGVFALINLWGSPAEGTMLGTVNRNFPPTLIVHGTADTTVPFSQSELLAGQLKEVGVANQLFPLSGAPHTPMQHLPAIVDACAKFLFDILTQPPPGTELPPAGQTAPPNPAGN